MTWNRRQFVKQSVLGVLAGLGRRAPTFAVAIPQSSSGLRASTGASGHRRRVDSIDWYYELRGQGRAIVLIPSGEGDCGSFEKVATLLSSAFKVLTFDMPGFSRSREPPGFANYSMDQAAAEVAGLVRALKLEPATFYGCSSGGQVALRLAADHSVLVRDVVVHEVSGLPLGQSAPLPLSATIAGLPKLTDGDIIRKCKELFRNELNESNAAWDALGDTFHKRLERNYVTWVRRYVAANRPARQLSAEDLRRRPVTWTIGGLTPAAAYLGNVVAAHAAGPQVSIPEALADHIANVARV
jgi:pimeloyl-ACP methyl ester carboxylesterase